MNVLPAATASVAAPRTIARIVATAATVAAVVAGLPAPWATQPASAHDAVQVVPIVPPGNRGVVVITGQGARAGVVPGDTRFQPSPYATGTAGAPGSPASPGVPSVPGVPGAPSAASPAAAPGTPGVASAPWIVPLVGLPPQLQAAVRNNPVLLFAPVDCPPCDEARAWLVARGVPYVEAVILSADDRALLRAQGFGAGYPALSIGPRRLSGFNDVLWGRTVDQAGYPVGIALPPGWRPPAAQPLATWRTGGPAPAPRLDPSSGQAPPAVWTAPLPWPVAPPMPLPRTNPALRPPPGTGPAPAWPEMPLGPGSDAAPDDTMPAFPADRPRRVRPPGQGWHSGAFDRDDWPGRPPPDRWARGPTLPADDAPGHGSPLPGSGVLLPPPAAAIPVPSYPPGVYPPGNYPPGPYAPGVQPSGSIALGAVGSGVYAPGVLPPGVFPPRGPGSSGWYAPPGVLVAPGAAHVPDGQPARGLPPPGSAMPPGVPVKPSPGSR